MNMFFFKYYLKNSKKCSLPAGRACGTENCVVHFTSVWLAP